MAIGNEIAEGRVANDNARWLARTIGSITAIAVGDVADQVLPALRFLRRHRLVVVSGGLGPTADDLTREFACRWLNCGLTPHQPTLAKVRRIMRRHVGGRMTPNNERQAMYPSHAKPLPNRVGGAVGFTVMRDRTRYFFFPGVPREFQDMVNRYVRPAVRSRVIPATVFRFSGIAESTLDHRIQKVLPERLRSQYGIYPSVQGISVVVRAARAADRRLFCALVRRHLADVARIDGETSPEAALIDFLRKRKLRLVAAESCTGGLFASTLTQVAGAGDVLIGGVVAYSNDLKTKLLGVPPRTIRRFGAVSPECAARMARGALYIYGGDVGVSITGIAGPGGGTAIKPVGTVHIGIATRGGITTRQNFFTGDRNTIRQKCVYAAIFSLLKDMAPKKSGQ